MKFKAGFLLVMVSFATSLASTPLRFTPSSPVDSQDRPPHNGCYYPSSTCVQMGCFYDHCDFDSEIEQVTRACRGVWDDGCLRALCEQRGDCSFLSRFVKYASLCGAGP